MNVHDLLAWAGPILDVAVVLGLAATWWQLRRDPTVAWHEYEQRLRELQESLRLLVVQAEGEARELDRRLAAHAEELGGLTSERPRGRDGAASDRVAARAGKSPAGPPVKPSRGGDEPLITPLAAAMAAAATAPVTSAKTSAPAAPDAPAPAASLAERVQQLAAVHTPIAEIARRLSLPIAEARVLAGLTTGGLGFGASPPAAPGKAPRARGASGAIAS